MVSTSTIVAKCVLFIMGEKGYEKTQEDILRERAEVLFTAGKRLSDALQQLKMIEKSINARYFKLLEDMAGDDTSDRIYRLQEVNDEIYRYNKAREYAKLRYYYLIVTREAMGFRRHTWVDEIYRIPGKKKYIKSINGQIPETKTEND